MTRSLCCLLLLVFCFACKGKKKEPKNTEGYFPVLASLQSQLKDIDTSLYSITRIESANGRSDTAYIRREDVRKYAQDFLTIPDLTKEKDANDYVQSKNYDEQIGTIFTYISDNPDQEVQKQEVTLKPTFGNADPVSTIYIEKTMDRSDSTVEKKMLWEAGRSFTITTLTYPRNGKEIIQKLKIAWQGDPSKYK